MRGKRKDKKEEKEEEMRDDNGNYKLRRIVWNYSQYSRVNSARCVNRTRPAVVGSTNGLIEEKRNQEER